MVEEGEEEDGICVGLWRIPVRMPTSPTHVVAIMRRIVNRRQRLKQRVVLTAEDCLSCPLEVDQDGEAMQNLSLPIHICAKKQVIFRKVECQQNQR